MSDKLHEIMITLFRNQDGYTLSVKPNYNYGGKEINFSFKGENTKTLKAVKDFTTTSPKVAEAIRAMILKSEFQDIYSGRESVDEVRFSKGYLAKQNGANKGKGRTVPAIAALIQDEGQWTVYIDFGIYKHFADLDKEAVTDAQRSSGAVAEYRWRDNSTDDDDDDDIYGFLGGSKDEQ